MVLACDSLSFGLVSPHEAPCDVPLEIVNRADAPDGASGLRVEDVQIVLEEVGEGAIFDGEELGFEIIAPDGEPLEISAAHPLRVPLGPGQAEGARRVVMRYRGERPGAFRGEASRGLGLRLFTNDPSRPVLTVPVRALGASPAARVTPDSLGFGALPPGSTGTGMLTLHNEGTRALEVQSVSFTPEFDGFSVTPSAPFTVAPGSSEALVVRYSPRDTDPRLTELRVVTDGPSSPLVTPISGGAAARCRLEAPSLEIRGPTPQTVRARVLNVGEAPLEITSLDILAPGGDREHPSVNDFSVELPGCEALPCRPALTACTPAEPGCELPASVEIPIIYDNDDPSSMDLVYLVIGCNDPLAPELRLALITSAGG